MAYTRIKRLKKTFTFGATGTTSTDQSIPVEGIIRSMTVDVPNFTNAITAAVTLEDSDALVYFDSGNLAKNTLHQVSCGVGLDGSGNLCVDISGVAGGTGGTVTVILFVEAYQY